MKKTPRRPRVRAALAALAAIGLASFGIAPAHAADYATEAHIDSLAFTQDEIESGSRAEMTGTWSLPDNPETPAGFVVELPDGLQGFEDEFPLRAPDGTVMGDCDVTETQLVCTFDGEYLADHPLNLSGTFSFWVEVTTEVTETTEKTYTFDELEATVTLTPPGTPCDDCVWEGQDSAKWGYYIREDETAAWHVNVAAPPGGMEGGLNVTVTDEGGPQLAIIPERTRLSGTDEFDTATGEPTAWRDVTDHDVTISADGSTVEFTSREGWVYVVIYYTQVLDGGAQGTYRNTATIEVEGEEPATSTNQVTRQGGGGTGSGDPVGAFSITKDVVWRGEPVDGIRFGGTYTVTAPDSTTSQGQFDVAEDETWTSPVYPRGSIVHVDEILPDEYPNIDWAQPVLSANDFALGESTVTVTLTNEATPATGIFRASKQISGDGQGLVPSDAEFLLEYSYPAGPGYPEGAGVLALPADGTVVTSEELPVGAELTLAEATPADVEGATWGDAQLSQTSLIIDRDAAVQVVVTNPIALTPTPTPEEPSPTPTPEEPTPTPTPEEPTPTPEEPTPTPEEPTPEEPTPTPEEPTPTPEEPTPTPEEPAPAPEEPTPTPEEPTPAPEVPTPAPEEPTPTPDESAPAPTPDESAPAPSPNGSTPEKDGPSGLAPTGGGIPEWIVPGTIGMILVGGLILAARRRRA